MDLLAPNIQYYHWGDYSFIPELQGRPKGDQPEAELWMGAHPISPSKTVESNRALDDIISTDPQNTLGPHASDFRNELPFIMKILAIREPLSIQVHPNAKQAEEGFASTHSGITAPQLYSSPRSKEEVVCALTETDLKFGFRELNEINAIIDAAGHSDLYWLKEGLSEETPDKGLKEVCEKILSTDPDTIRSIASTVLSADMEATVINEKEMKYFADLIETYPDDPGLLLFLLMNFVTLEPGDFLYVSPGSTHAYLRGNVVEVTSNSDNVIRCGLTPKHVNTQEFLSIASFVSQQPQIQKPAEPLHSYESPTPFILTRLDLNEEFKTAVHGPEVLISTQNDFNIIDNLKNSIHVEQGQPVWIPYSDTGYKITGNCLVFRCATNPDS
jgi:mannose-6-phosphate isomerase